MDAHFAEYVAAVDSMQELYGERADGLPSDFHPDPEQGAAEPSDPATLDPSPLDHEYLGV